MVARLQVKASQIGKILQSLENQNKSENEKHHKKTASIGQSGKIRVDGPPQKKPHYIDPIPPFNANKIRKSPSMSATTTAVIQPTTTTTTEAPTPTETTEIPTTTQ